MELLLRTIHRALPHQLPLHLTRRPSILVPADGFHTEDRMKLPRQHATGIAPQRWTPPSKWSSCAKCKLEVNAFITTSIIAAGYLTGGPTPGAISLVQVI